MCYLDHIGFYKSDNDVSQKGWNNPLYGRRWGSGWTFSIAVKQLFYRVVCAEIVLCSHEK